MKKYTVIAQIETIKSYRIPVAADNEDQAKILAKEQLPAYIAENARCVEKYEIHEVAVKAG